MSENTKAPRTNQRRGMMGGPGGGPGGSLGRPVEKAKNFKGTLKRLLFKATASKPDCSCNICDSCDSVYGNRS